MSKIDSLFENILELTNKEGQNEFISIIKTLHKKDQLDNFNNTESYILLKSFIQKIFDIIDDLGSEIRNDRGILISLKNQKLLRTCFQLITSLGISPCLLPGLGIPLSKRCSSSFILPIVTFTDEQKYEMLVNCVNFFTRCYGVPVFKNIIITFHLSDYLATLIQLSFAPLKKPGTYNNFVMSKEMYDNLIKERQSFINIYENLVSNSFQPMLMKELLILQSVTEPPPPMFVKRVIAKEMSQRLLCPGGLLSIMRCFLETHNIDSGYDWKKTDMLCRLVVAKHGTCAENEYLQNICEQLTQILCLNNTHYLSTALACLLSLHEKYPDGAPVKVLMKETFQFFNIVKDSIPELPGTILVSPQQVSQKINILHECVSTKLHWSIELLKHNLHILFLVGVKCTKNHELSMKLIDILGKCFERLNKDEVFVIIQTYLLGNTTGRSRNISIEEYDAGVAIKSVISNDEDRKEDYLSYFITLFNASSDNFAQNVFEMSLQILIELNTKRKDKTNKDMLLVEVDPILLNKLDEQYIIMLHLLSEISTSPKIVNALKTKPMMILQFMEHFILKEYDANDECASISLVLLHTILTTSHPSHDLKKNLMNFVPTLTKIANDFSSFNHVLSKEIISLITSDTLKKKDSPYEKALTNIFDNLLPVKAHGLIELTKLIDSAEPETISKKHFVFCLFQEQLKHSDSYVYLAAINGLAALCRHCTEDVLHVLCKEFLQLCDERETIETKESANRNSERRMKIGDIIVKVTKQLGDMAIVHKSTLLNTMLCGCRDQDPLIRTSALSNLAEIAVILHYKIGSIIYEVLTCVWSIIETDKAVECRRAAVMVISNLIRGLGKETLIQLKDNLLPIYRTLKELYSDPNEDSVVRLHAQIALEELNDVVNQFLFPELRTEKQIFVLDKPENVFK